MRGTQPGMGEITTRKVHVYDQARKTGMSIEQAIAKAKSA